MMWIASARSKGNAFAGSDDLIGSFAKKVASELASAGLVGSGQPTVSR